MFPATASCQSRDPCSDTDVTYPCKIAYLTNGSGAQIMFGCSEDQIGSFWTGLLSMAYLGLVREVFVPIILVKERPLLLGYIEKAGTLDNGVFPCTHRIKWKPITPTQINGADTQTLMPEASNS